MRETLSASVLMAAVLCALTGCAGGGEAGCTDGDTRPCYTGPSEVRGVGACRDGVQSCVGGAWTEDCPGEVLPSVEACDGRGADENCDGRVDEGFVQDTTDGSEAACSSTLDTSTIPSRSGDDASAAYIVKGYTEKWFRLRFTEDLSFLDPFPLTAYIFLKNPPGIDFDLYVYCSACGGTPSWDSTKGGLGGHEDVVNVAAHDNLGYDDGFDVIAEVRFYDAVVCREWELSVGSGLRERHPVNDIPTLWCN
jgi:hypothetical protein